MNCPKYRRGADCSWSGVNVTTHCCQLGAWSPCRLLSRCVARAYWGQTCRHHLHRQDAPVQGEVLLDATSKTTPAVAAEYAHYTEGTWSSKGMLELIRQKMSAAALDSDDRPSTSTSSPLGAPLFHPLKTHVGRICSALR